MSKLKKTTISSLPIALIFLAGLCQAQPESTVSLRYDSKYVSEGRDNLNFDGMRTLSYRVSQDGLSAGIWRGEAESVLYEETNIFIQYAFALGDFESYLSYTYLDFNSPMDFSYVPSDHELGLGIASTGWPLTVALDARYSEEANGSFVEFSLSKEARFFDAVTASLAAVAEFDLGYISHDYDGINNYRFDAVLEFAIAKAVSISTYASHSIAATGVERDGGEDQTWAGVALNLSW